MRLIIFLLLLPLTLSAAGTLDIYWIDVEGGAATLIVTPEGETVLMDAGWPGFDSRDAKRIEHVLSKEAGADQGLTTSSPRIFTVIMSAGCRNLPSESRSESSSTTATVSSRIAKAAPNFGKATYPWSAANAWRRFPARSFL